MPALGYHASETTARTSHRQLRSLLSDCAEWLERVTAENAAPLNDGELPFATHCLDDLRLALRELSEEDR